MRSFELKYNLIQQTPIIHFQHNEDDATLRASEVKPKLDKFIINMLGGFDAVYEEHPEWFVGYDKKKSKEEQKDDIKPALNYKMRFFADGEPKPLLPYGIYYGNMGSGQKVNMLRGNCNMTILCFNADLRAKIEEVIKEFFIVHNFGRMQNKGFGSYVAFKDGEKRIDPKIAEAGSMLCKMAGSKAYYTMQITKQMYEEELKDRKTKAATLEEYIFDKIKDLYSVMKSGRSFGGYVRSYLVKYFYNRRSLGNEKRLLKEKKISPDIKKSTTRIPLSPKVEEYRYIRALLGVGDHIDYIKALDHDKPVKILVNGREKVDKLSVTIKNADIERFSSPIFFKVLDNVVIIVAKRINEGIYDKEFKFTGWGEIDIRTPKKTEFDIDEFMDFFVTNANNDKVFKYKINRYAVGGDNI